MNPNLATQSGTQQAINQAYQSGQARTRAINAQSANDQNIYGQSVNQANQAYGTANNQLQQANQARANMSNYVNNLPSYRNMYSNYFNQGQSALGYNPATTNAASQNSANIAEAYANVPRAAQQMSNYSGATAGQETQNLSNMAGNLSGASAQANQLYQNQLAAQANVLGYANQASNVATTGEQNKIGAYNDILTGANTTYANANQTYANATAQMQAAGQTMSSIMQTASQQGYYNAQQISALQNAHSNYVSAQAAATRAAAAASMAPSTIAANQAQAAANRQSIIGAFLHSNPNTTAQNMANALGIPLDQAGAYLTGMGNRGLSVGTNNGSGISLGNALNNNRNVQGASGIPLQGSYGGALQ